MNHTTSIGRGAPSRNRLLKTLDELPMPEAAAFRSLAAPSPGELSSYRLVEDRKLRERLTSAGLIQTVQSPGPGNWKKTTPPPYIARVYPNFDAPAGRGRPPRAGRTAAAGTATSRLPGPIVHELREKWEAYYVDTRPENQRRHAQRAQAVEPNAISVRANEIIGEMRRKGRTHNIREAMLQATDELTSDFETAMRRKYGDLIVDALGIPDATDTRIRE